MGVKTGISWTDHTFNPWWGCARVSPGCVNCYAEAQAARFGTGWGTQAPRRFFGDAHWREPLAWDRAAAEAGRPAFVFCSSMADVFESRGANGEDVELDGARARLWALIAATPNLVWLLLTKRPHNVAALVPPTWINGAWPDNVWLGVTTEDQQRADERLPVALQIPAPVHFASYEPALGPVDFEAYLHGGWRLTPNVTEPGVPMEVKSITRHRAGIDWIIVGGESGPRARPFNVEWAVSTVRQCRAAGADPFVKQMGANAVIDDSILADLWASAATARVDDVGRVHCVHKAGSNPAEWPEWLRVQERPDPVGTRSSRLIDILGGAQ